MPEATDSLEQGDMFPYDGGEDFWDTVGATPPPPVDWAHRAARGIVANLSDRRGIKQALYEVDHDVRAELVTVLADIIRKAEGER